MPWFFPALRNSPGCNFGCTWWIYSKVLPRLRFFLWTLILREKKFGEEKKTDKGGHWKCHCKYIEKNGYRFFLLIQCTNRCCHNLLAVTQIYNSKNTPSAKFHAFKIAKSVFLYLFTMAFPTSPLRPI